MNKTFRLPLLLLAMSVIAGCADLPPISEEVSNLDHQFVAQPVNAGERVDPDVTFALLDRGVDGKWSLVALSHLRMPVTKASQERVLVSKKFTNLVPSWDCVAVDFAINPKTESQFDHRFTGCLSRDKTDRYTPEVSAFASDIGNPVKAAPTASMSASGVITSTSIGPGTTVYVLSLQTLGEAATQTDLINKVRQFSVSASAAR